MQLILGPDGWVYLTERGRILRVKDTDGDGKGDLEETLAALDTLADYPHNGLSGMAWHPDGGLVFSLGENFGKDWILTARDGSKVNGRGEGGVFRCTPDGKAMRRIARKADMRILVEGVDTDAWIELAPPTPFTLGQEQFARHLTLMDLAIRPPWRTSTPAERSQA
jgi:hypothetical protein